MASCGCKKLVTDQSGVQWERTKSDSGCDRLDSYSTL